MLAVHSYLLSQVSSELAKKRSNSGCFRDQWNLTSPFVSFRLFGSPRQPSSSISATDCAPPEHKKENISESVELFPFPSDSIFPQPLTPLWFEKPAQEIKSLEISVQIYSSDNSGETQVENPGLQVEITSEISVTDSSADEQTILVAAEAEDLVLDSGLVVEPVKAEGKQRNHVNSLLSVGWDRHMLGLHSLWRGFRRHIRVLEPSISILPGKTSGWAKPYLEKWQTEQKLLESNASKEHFENLKAIRGTSTCKQCGACSADKKASCGSGQSDSEVKVHSAESFQPFLHQTRLGELRSVAFLAELSDLAYTVSDIQPDQLQKKYQLTLITSSYEQKIANEKENEEKIINEQERLLLNSPIKSPIQEAGSSKADATVDIESKVRFSDLLSETSKSHKEDSPSEIGCPCEWFISDNEKTKTRYIAIQGSDSLASWQTNLTFDPVQFENESLNVVVHRGIYEAAKSLFKSLNPLVVEFLEKNGPNAKIQFTGHSLGGSLATLVALMMRIKGSLPKHALKPIYTFGAPSIMCGGDHLLESLGHSRSHLRQVMIHRDLVPRAFACDYPDHIAKVLASVSSSFKEHPCLLHQKLMYSPAGTAMILQPEESQTPFYPLLPPVASLFEIKHPLHSNANLPHQQSRCHTETRSVQRWILNNPHPLEVLADPASYGSDGSISKHHDPRNYASALRKLVAAASKAVRKAQKKRRKTVQWFSQSGQDMMAVRSAGGSNLSRSWAVKFRNSQMKARKVNRLGASSQVLFVTGVSLGLTSVGDLGRRNLIASQHF